MAPHSMVPSPAIVEASIGDLCETSIAAENVAASAAKNRGQTILLGGVLGGLIVASLLLADV